MYMPDRRRRPPGKAGMPPTGRRARPVSAVVSRRKARPTSAVSRASTGARTYAPGARVGLHGHSNV